MVCKLEVQNSAAVCPCGMIERVSWEGLQGPTPTKTGNLNLDGNPYACRTDRLKRGLQPGCLKWPNER
jgi:hypothetical protein